jgi:hypothetical protein
MLTAGCLVPFETIVDTGPARVAVSGQVSTIEHRNFIQIWRTARADQHPLPLQGSEATLIDEGTGQEYNYHEDPQTPGLYKLDQGFVGKIGSRYSIIFSDPDRGKNYHSAVEELPATLGVDSIYYNFSKETITDGEGISTVESYVNVRSKIRINENSSRWYMRWMVDEIYLLVPTDTPDIEGHVPPPCYISQAADPQRGNLLSSATSNGAITKDLLLAKRITGDSFHSKHCFLTYQSSCTSNAYEYWRKVNALVGQVGTIFDPPPAEIKGNIQNDNDATEVVYGYFQAVNESYSRMFLYSSDMPYGFLPYCEYTVTKPKTQYNPECIDCRRAPNSSFIEPELFKTQ